MTQDSSTSVETVGLIENLQPIPIRQWLWNPWFAKLWWASIPVYWSLIFFTSLSGLLQNSVWGGLIALLNVLFTPAAPLLILGMPVLRDQLGLTSDLRDADDEDESEHDEESELCTESAAVQRHHLYGFRNLNVHADASNPLAALNPSNPAHPSYHRWTN